MTKFCEQCPLRHQATGEIERIIEMQYPYEIRDMGCKGTILDSNNGLVGVLVDELGNTSLPIKCPDTAPHDVLNSYSKRINNCAGPIIQVVGNILPRKYPVGCNALGLLAVRRGEVSAAILESIPTKLT